MSTSETWCPGKGHSQPTVRMRTGSEEESGALGSRFSPARASSERTRVDPGRTLRMSGIALYLRRRKAGPNDQRISAVHAIR